MDSKTESANFITSSSLNYMIDLLKKTRFYDVQSGVGKNILKEITNHFFRYAFRNIFFQESVQQINENIQMRNSILFSDGRYHWHRFHSLVPLVLIIVANRVLQHYFNQRYYYINLEKMSDQNFIIRVWKILFCKIGSLYLWKIQPKFPPKTNNNLWIKKDP